MFKKYHIVPQNNGYYMLGLINNKILTLVSKKEPDGSELEFNTPEEAESFINTHNLNSMCEVEFFLEG